MNAPNFSQVLRDIKSVRADEAECAAANDLSIPIDVLSQQAHNARTNEPIHRASGDHDQADLEQRVFETCLEAIEVLKSMGRA